MKAQLEFEMRFYVHVCIQAVHCFAAFVSVHACVYPPFSAVYQAGPLP